jgi:hypothetical protein
MVVFALRLTLADMQYIAGLPPRPFDETTLPHMLAAFELWPFERRYIEGPAMRFKVWVDQGK